ncbi:MAG: sigma-70 family RNA polymerase sigma factor [Armatimonadota bacterium]
MEQQVPKAAHHTPRVTDYLPLVGTIARALSRGLPPSVELDELINDGVIGLIEAARRYDPTRGVGFSTYAGHRIRGAMLDGLRVRDPLPRRIRRAHKAEQADPRNQTAGRGIQFHELDDALMIPDDEACEPEARILEEELLHDLHCGLLELPPRDRQVLLLRMVRGMTLRAVAMQLELSITRIAEIQTRGIVRLRRFLAGEPMIRPRRRARGCSAPLPRREIVPRRLQEEGAAKVPNGPVTSPVASPGHLQAVGVP